MRVVSAWLFSFSRISFGNVFISVFFNVSFANTSSALISIALLLWAALASAIISALVFPGGSFRGRDIPGIDSFIAFIERTLPPPGSRIFLAWACFFESKLFLAFKVDSLAISYKSVTGCTSLVPDFFTLSRILFLALTCSHNDCSSVNSFWVFCSA